MNNNTTELPKKIPSKMFKNIGCETLGEMWDYVNMLPVQIENEKKGELEEKLV